MTVGCPASITATQELVVPRSIPMIFPITILLPPEVRWVFSTRPLSIFSLRLSSIDWNNLVDIANQMQQLELEVAHQTLPLMYALMWWSSSVLSANSWCIRSRIE